MSEELIPDVSLISNSSERLPVVLALDCSRSMEGAKIEALNEAVRTLTSELQNDARMARAVRILVVTFGGDDEVEVGQWQDMMDFTAPKLVANGRTPTGAAMMRVLAEVEAQKQEMRSASVHYKRPLVYLISDGDATDEWAIASERCLAEIRANKLSIFPIGVGDEANLEQLSAFTDRGALRLQGLKFKELFAWLSASIKVVGATPRGQASQLPPNDSWSSTPP